MRYHIFFICIKIRYNSIEKLVSYNQVNAGYLLNVWLYVCSTSLQQIVK